MANTTYVSFKSNGSLFTFGSLKKSLAEIKTAKEKNGVTVFAITEDEYNDLTDGCDASESGGIVTIGQTIGGATQYKYHAKGKQKKIAMHLHQRYEKDLGNSDVDISTYRNNLRSYYISDVKTPINAAANKAEVDAAVAAIDWSSAVIP